MNPKYEWVIVMLAFLSTTTTLEFTGFLSNEESQDQIRSALQSEGASYLTTALCWRGLCTAGVSWLLSEPIKPLSVSGDMTPSCSVRNICRTHIKTLLFIHILQIWCIVLFISHCTVTDQRGRFDSLGLCFQAHSSGLCTLCQAG